MLKVRSLQIVTTNLSYPKDRSAKTQKLVGCVTQYFVTLMVACTRVARFRRSFADVPV